MPAVESRCASSSDSDLCRDVRGRSHRCDLSCRQRNVDRKTFADHLLLPSVRSVLREGPRSLSTQRLGHACFQVQ